MALTALAPLPFADEKSKLKITGIRLVRTRQRHPLPSYTPDPNSWSTQGVEVANPMSIYPEYKAMRSLFMPDGGKVPSFTVEISTDKGIKGYGNGGPGGGMVVLEHLTKLLLNRDPFDIERNWDICWRSTMSYGRMGVTMNAISGIDMAMWDIVGKALNMPVYKLIGGEVKDRVPAYCTGNDIEQHVEFGYKRLKLAIPHGPADGRDGMKKNVELVKRARTALGPDGDIMLDCWMSWDVPYTIQMARRLEEYSPRWIEEPVLPDKIEQYAEIRRNVNIPISGGEHEYTRWGLKMLMDAGACDVLQADIYWAGGISEMQKICALASAYDLPVIPHGHSTPASAHLIAAWPKTTCPLLEYLVKWNEIHQHFLKTPLKPQGGMVTLPTTPGLGMELDEDKIDSQDELNF